MTNYTALFAALDACTLPEARAIATFIEDAMSAGDDPEAQVALVLARLDAVITIVRSLTPTPLSRACDRRVLRHLALVAA